MFSYQLDLVDRGGPIVAQHFWRVKDGGADFVQYGLMNACQINEALHCTQLFTEAGI